MIVKLLHTEIYTYLPIDMLGTADTNYVSDKIIFLIRTRYLFMYIIVGIRVPSNDVKSLFHMHLVLSTIQTFSFLFQLIITITINYSCY